MSDGPDSSLNLLHAKVQGFVQRQGWDGLRPIQEQAVRVILGSNDDLLISAPTNGGKTEAAFLPIISRILETKSHSFQTLYLGGLKALINDQIARLSKMLEGTGLPAHAWHGDISDYRKQLLRLRPKGILLITPESLESNLINFGHHARKLFGSLEFVVIDELHSFLDNERGMHLRSLLSRIREITGQRPRFVGLSATLADVASAQSFLNRENPGRVQIVQEKVRRRFKTSMKTVLIGEAGSDPNTKDFVNPLAQIAQNIHEEFVGSTNLIFANSRRTVEGLAVLLKQFTEGESSYQLHHGSLSRQVRTVTESALKSDEAVNAICTNTLELGIDIGAIKAVAQVDPPSTVSALVQRVGRSGRQSGMAATLRFYLRCNIPERDPALTDLLFPQLLQGIALVQLAEEGWLEPQNPDRPHLSTLVHQVLSLLKQHGGLVLERMFCTLCQEGPFRQHSRLDFEMLLAGIESHGLIRVDSEGYYVLASKGEKITSRLDFYAAFTAPFEIAVRHGSDEIGKLPAGIGFKKGDRLLLDARHWEVCEIDWKRRTIWVVPTRFAKPPIFLGGPGDVHARVHEEMRLILLSTDVPSWLDDQGAELLQSARDAARYAGLINSNVLVSDTAVQWFPWVGTCGLRTFIAWATSMKINFTTDSLCIRYSRVNLKQFQTHISALERADPVSLARLLPDRERQKFDQYVHPDLLDKANAVDRLDLAAASKSVHEALCETTKQVQDHSASNHLFFSARGKIDARTCA